MSTRSRVRVFATGQMALMIAAGLALVAPAPALGTATFVVNRTGDAPDNNLADARCDTSTATGKQCTLRAAIQEANDTAGNDVISFNITSTSKVIAPGNPLPPITDAVNVNGYSQAGASTNTLSTGDNAVLKVVLDGIGAGAAANGLEIQASSVTVTGLVIQRFKGSGLLISGPFNQISGNFIGTNAAGTLARANGTGMSVTGSSNYIGSYKVYTRNIISGNAGHGVSIVGSSATDNNVQGNYIGTRKSGTAALPNLGNGVNIHDATNTDVGLGAANAGNLISGNAGNGVAVFKEPGTGASDTVIAGNFIGTDATGTADLGNALAGVVSQALAVQIGGTTASARNVISGNGHAGITLNGGDDNIIQGNRIGTKADGTGDLGNDDGIFVTQAADNNTIGGTASGAGNLISGNQFDGVFLDDGTTNVVQGNVIRLNGFHGVLAANGVNSIGPGNVIFGNGEDGIEVSAAASGVHITANQIFGNGALGIDLHGGTENAAKVTSNDTDDPDTGANRLQNYPVLISAVRAASGLTTITGNLDSAGSTQFTIELFIAAADPSNNGEGQIFIATQTITTNSGGDKSFTFQLASLSPGMTLTATASTTAFYGDTSEFSNNVTVVQGS